MATAATIGALMQVQAGSFRNTAKLDRQQQLYEARMAQLTLDLELVGAELVAERRRCEELSKKLNDNSYNITQKETKPLDEVFEKHAKVIEEMKCKHCENSSMNVKPSHKVIEQDSPSSSTSDPSGPSMAKFATKCANQDKTKIDKETKYNCVDLKSDMAAFFSVCESIDGNVRIIKADMEGVNSLLLHTYILMLLLVIMNVYSLSSGNVYS